MTKQEIIDYMYKNHVQGDFKIEEMAEDFSQPDLQPTCNNLATDTISRQVAIDAVNKIAPVNTEYDCTLLDILDVRYVLTELPSAQPEQRYTEEELRVFKHGISLSLLSKRSSQHWRYDEDTATEIEFLERLYEKVVADMRGEQDE